MRKAAASVTPADLVSAKPLYTFSLFLPESKDLAGNRLKVIEEGMNVSILNIPEITKLVLWGKAVGRLKTMNQIRE